MCATSDYKFQGNLEAVVDVYRFNTADGAKQLFRADPATNSQSAQLGDEARVYGQSVVFRQGQVLVRIVAYESGPRNRGGFAGVRAGRARATLDRISIQRKGEL